jgi:hypothetical protein
MKLLRTGVLVAVRTVGTILIYRQVHKFFSYVDKPVFSWFYSKSADVFYKFCLLLCFHGLFYDSVIIT